MKIDNVSFPYPVLGISDDISPALPQNNAVVTYDEVQPGLFEFSVVLNFDNEDIKRYIQEGYAEYSVEVNCRSTLFRQCFKSDTSCIKFTIDKYRLHNKVTFESFLRPEMKFDSVEELKNQMNADKIKAKNYFNKK